MSENKEKNKEKTIAAFDFDGTITTKDTLFDFIRFYFGLPKLMIGLIILSPMLTLFKVGLIKNSKAKELLISYFFKNTDIHDFNKQCALYSIRIDNISRVNILEKIQWHIKQHHTVVIVSASIRNWIEPWAVKNGVSLIISTEIEEKLGKLTGKFATNNCYGQEKVNRLLNSFPNREDYILYAYGDSRGDKELLEIADYPTLVKKEKSKFI